MLDLARSIRGFLTRFSEMEVMGVPIDWFFHFSGVALVVIVATRFFPRRVVVRIALGLILAKELFDVFAKTRAEYIRPPGIDLIFDVTAGLVGLVVGLWIAKKVDRRWRAPA